MPALVGLLLVVFLIAGLLVYEAWSTGRSRRDIVERGLQDYAAYASWSTARAGENSLAASLSTLFRGVIGNRVDPKHPVASLEQLVAGANYLRQCGCAVDIPADYYFRYDRRTGSIATQAPPALSLDGGPANGWASAKVGAYVPPAPRPEVPAESATLRAALDSVANLELPSFAVLFDAPGFADRVLGVAQQRGADGRVVGILGFTLPAREFADSTFAPVWMRSKLLPYAITRGAPNDSLLAAVITTPAGREIFRSMSWINSLRSDTASLGTFGGGMRVRVGLREDATLRLQGGLVPASRVPVWVGLLMLTGILTVFIVRNLQREHELARLRLDFSASVSHELRTPLAQILLFGETLTLNRARTDAERTTAASIIVREARRLMHLVDNTLTFSRSEKQVARVTPRSTVLEPIVHEVIAGFQPIASARNVTIARSLDPSVSTFVDPESFGQMLLNLLDNAVKYGPRGQVIKVSLTSGHSIAAKTLPLVARQPARTKTVRLTVDDQGPGISHTGADEIWTPFARGTHGEAVGTGFGLGLSVVRELATRHDGTAWVEAAPHGEGSRFVVELPDSSEIPAGELPVIEPVSEKIVDGGAVA